MKRGFIRGLWGIYDNSTRVMQRRARIDRNINDIIKNQYNQPFVTYIFGQENYNMMTEKKLNCIMIDKNPAPFDQQKFVYRNKLELIRYAMENDGYDEIVYMDWDCIPQKAMPNDFWEQLGKKEEFQACLQIYKKKKCFWRTEGQRTVPNGGFLYIRNKTYPSMAIKCWENILPNQDNDEPAWAKFLDEKTNGWIGEDKYWDLFEPMCCLLYGKSPYVNKMTQKDICFTHFHGR